jgi:hypothetical protein
MEPLNLGRYRLDESIRGPIRNRHRNRRWIVYIELTEVDSYKRSSSELAGTRSNKRRPPKDNDHPKTKTIPRQILSEDRFHLKTDPIRRQIPSEDRSYPKTDSIRRQILSEDGSARTRWRTTLSGKANCTEHHCG